MSIIHSMGKRIDEILVGIIITLSLAIVLLLLKVNTIIVISISIILIATFSILSIISKSKRKNHISYRDFIIFCIIKGDDYLKGLICEEIYKTSEFKLYDNFFLLDRKPIFLSLKFSSVSYEQIINFNKICLQNGYNSAVVITSIKDRKILNLLKYLDVKFSFMSLYPIYKKLKKLDLLPSITKQKFSIKNISFILENAFLEKRIKFYILPAIIVFLLSFITVFKTYYLIMSIMLVILALIATITSIISKNISHLK